MTGADTPPAGAEVEADVGGAEIGVPLGDGVPEGVPEGVPPPVAGLGELVEVPAAGAECFADVDPHAAARQTTATTHSPARTLEAMLVPAPRIGPPVPSTCLRARVSRPPRTSLHHRVRDGQSAGSGRASLTVE
ncbi:hypothetical protein [Catenulispora acidiphila]|nr:hypothetical protein [Catenulispora acidiphila]